MKLSHAKVWKSKAQSHHYYRFLTILWYTDFVTFASGLALSLRNHNLGHANTRKNEVESYCNVCEALICKLVYLFIVIGEHGRYIGNINHLW